MKSFKFFAFLCAFTALSIGSFAQSKKTETIPVSGNCGMCKTSIEKAAKKSGATAANWNADTKKLTVTYSSATTNAGKIQQAIAEVGYDTRDVKATDAAYDKLHGCCKYDRTAAAKTGCAEGCEMKDGKCTMGSCKEKGCCKEDAACCSAATKEAGQGDHSKAASCCKEDGKTAANTKEKSCCSASH